MPPRGSATRVTDVSVSGYWARVAYRWVDDGIGPYEYWGARGWHSVPAVEIVEIMQAQYEDEPIDPDEVPEDVVDRMASRIYEEDRWAEDRWAEE